MKIRNERVREALYIGCVYMPTDSTSVSIMDSCYERLKEDVPSFKEKGKLFCWVISMLGLVDLHN